MARDGAGVYNLPPGNPVVTETVISSTTHNATLADVATALTQSVARDGQTTYTGNQSMGGFRHTQVANGTARDQYTTVAQVQDGNLTLIGSLSGTDTLTGTISPAITAYANGVFLTMIPAATNTGPVTLALNGLAARPVVKQNGAALVAGDLLVGVPATLVYNGTSFYLENPGNLATINGAPVTDFARLSTSNVFTAVGTSTAPNINVSSALPIIGLNNTSAPANARSWLSYVDTSGGWVVRADSDDHTSSSTMIHAQRTGATVTSLAFAATNITLNGVNVTDYARLSQPAAFQSTLTAGAAPGVGGYVSLVGASPSFPGYVEFRTQDAVRRGYMGFRDGANNFLLIAGDGGWSWKFLQTPYVGAVPMNDASFIATGTFANARVAPSNVTQHQAALAINASQVTAVPGDISASAAVNASLAGRILTVTNSSTVTLTVSNNCLGGDGKAALFIRRGTGAVDFSASGVTIRSPGGGTSITIQHGKVALIQMSSTEYELAGNV